MNTSAKRIVISGLSSALLLIGSGAWAQSTKFTVVFTTPTAPYLAAFYVSEDKGFYKDAGLDVDYKTVAGDQNGVRALVTGTGDVTVVGGPILYEAVLNGARLKGIGGGNQALTDYFLVLGKDKGTTLKDAAGKTLAISNPGSLPQIVPEVMFRQEKIDTAGTRYISVGGFSARYQAVVAGKVDGSLVDTITALRGEQAGETHIVADAQKIIREPIGYTYTVASSDALQDPVKRKALQSFVTATTRGARYIVDHPDQAVTSIQTRLKDTPIDLLKSTVSKLNEEKVWGLNGGVEEKIHTSSIKIYLEYKLVSKDVSYKDAFDPSLADEAVKELGSLPGWQ